MRHLLCTIICLIACSFYTQAKDTPSSFPKDQLYFVENKGQITDQYGILRKDIQYALHTTGLDVFIGNGEIHYQFSKPTGKSNEIETYRLDVKLVGATNSKEITSELLPTDNNYRVHSTGEMVTAQTATKLVYKDVYPGIDWAIYIKDGKLEYDFIVADGSEASTIKQQYFGASNIDIGKTGGLEIITPLGSIHEQTPVAYLEDGSKVKSSFRMAGKTVSFKLAEYKGKVTIDPVITWGTYYGGSADDAVTSVATDASGNLYACGYTLSTSNIATVGSQQQILGGMSDGFIVKFNAAGVRQWGTYYGGADDDALNSITCDNSGNVYACGRTMSTGINTPGVHQTTMYGLSDAFLVKMNSAGILLYCTYYGGFSNESGNGVKCDASGNVFICGSTTSGNNIATTGTHQAFQFGGSQAFLAKFNNAGVRQWGTYFGGSTDEWGNALDIDGTGYIYLCGRSTSFDYVGTTGAFQSTQPGGANDGFLAKFVNFNGHLSWSTYCGDAGDDVATGVTCSPDYSVYLSGNTDGNTTLFTTGAHQVVNNGLMDGFIEKFDSAGVRQWGTYYGGSSDDLAGTVACNSNGDVIVHGSTSSSASIATTGSYQTVLEGTWDAFMVAFNSAGVRQWGTYYGGMIDEYASAITTFGSSIYIGGNANSLTGLSTVGAHQINMGGGIDGFIARFQDCYTPSITALGDTTFCQGDSVILTGPVGVGLTYQWKKNGTNITGATDTTYTALTNGNYSVVVTDGACGGVASQTILVTVNPLPVPVVTQTGNVLGTGTFTTYAWSLNGIAINGATNQTYTPTTNGNYSVTVTDGNGCQGTSANYQYLNVNNVNNTQMLTLYPNPNNGSFTISGNIEGGEQEATVSMIDMVGRILFTEVVPVRQGAFSTRVSLDKVAPGAYTMKVISGDNARTIPFVVK